MQDFGTPFNPHGSTPKVVGNVAVRPECCGNVCSPDCVVGQQVKDTDLVTLQIPVGFQAVDLTKDENFDDVIDQETGKVIGRTPKSGEIYEELTLTVAQLKDLVVSRLFVAAGNYEDTRAVINKVKRDLNPGS